MQNSVNKALCPGHTFTSPVPPRINAIFRSPIRMHNGVATSFDVSTKDKIEKEPFDEHD